MELELWYMYPIMEGMEKMIWNVCERGNIDSISWIGNVLAKSYLRERDAMRIF